MKPPASRSDLERSRRVFLVVLAGMFSVCAAIVGVIILWESSYPRAGRGLHELLTPRTAVLGPFQTTQCSPAATGLATRSFSSTSLPTQARMAGTPTQAPAVRIASPAPSSSALAVMPTPSPAVKCCRLRLAAGENFVVTLRNACYYHFSLAGGEPPGGTNDNFVVRYDGEAIDVTVTEGCAWEYDREPDSADVCLDAAHRWPTRLPPFLSLPGVKQVFPCSSR